MRWSRVIGAHAFHRRCVPRSAAYTRDERAAGASCGVIAERLGVSLSVEETAELLRRLA